jgi:S-DNA-T family DNA segregation ATPase FtsK/SpoIIIE
MFKKQWKTPQGPASHLVLDFINQTHLLIAGTTGSGKSVIINNIIYHLLYKSPKDVKLILIDPKKVELVNYKDLPHTLAYASEQADIIKTIKNAVTLMEQRYRTMQKQGIKKSKEADIYIIIDEYADLITTSKKDTERLICRIAQLGRAAKIHLIIATQRPTRDIITGQVKVNIDSRLALRVPTAQDSRNIINVKGAEQLGKYGQAFYLTPDTLTPQLVNIDYINDLELADRVKWWTSQTSKIFNNIYKKAYI